MVFQSGAANNSDIPNPLIGLHARNVVWTTAGGTATCLPSPGDPNEIRTLEDWLNWFEISILPSVCGIAQGLATDNVWIGDAQSRPIEEHLGRAIARISGINAVNPLVIFDGAGGITAGKRYGLPPNATGGPAIFYAVGDGDASVVGAWIPRPTGAAGVSYYLGVDAVGMPQWETLPYYDLPNPTEKSQLLVSTDSGDEQINTQWLRKGAPGQVLTVDGTDDLAWLDPTPRYDLPDSTGPGQLLLSFKAGDPETSSSWMPAGASGTVLTVTNTGDIGWLAPQIGTTTLPDPTQKSQILISRGGGSVNAVSQWLIPGSPGQILSVAGNDDLVWIDSTDQDHRLPEATGRGQLLMALGAGDPHTTASGGQGRSTWFPVGNANQVLQVHSSGTGLAWGDKYDLPDATGRNQIFMSSAAGDPSGVGTWLAAPLPNQILSSSPTGILTWTNLPSSYDLPDATAAGQLFIATGAGDPSSVGAWLTPGAPQQVLQVNAAGVPEWTNAALTDTNSQLPFASAKGQLLVTNAGGDPHSLASGGGGKSYWLSPNDPGDVLMLTATGEPAWLPAPGINATGTTTLPNPTRAQQLLVSTAAGVVSDETTWIDPGTPGQVLTVAPGGTLFWTAPAATVNSMIPDAIVGGLLMGIANVDPHTTASGGAGGSAWLGPGVNGQVLTMRTGTPTWETLVIPAAIPDPTNSQTILYSTAGGPVNANSAWLPLGAPDQVLTSNGTALAWSDRIANTDHLIPIAPNPNYLLYSTAAGDPHSLASGGGGASQWLQPGTPGQTLMVGATGALTWEDAPALPDPTARGQLIYSTAAGDIGTNTAWLPQGTPGQYLTTDAGGNPYWEDLAIGMNSDHLIPVTPAAGYLLYSIGAGNPHTAASGGDGAAQWLAPGQVGQVLAVGPTGSDFRWVDQVTPTVPYDLPDAATANQLFISNAAGDPSGSGSWLPRPVAGQYLTTDGNGNVRWIAQPNESDHQIPLSPGDAYLLVSTGVGDPHSVASGGGGFSVWLAPGTNQQVLSIDNGRLRWMDQSECCLPDATRTNQILVSTAAGPATANSAWLDPGVPGQYLTPDAVGNLYWETLPGAVDNDHLIPETPGPGSVLYSVSAGDPHTVVSGGGGSSAWLAPGTLQQVLTMGPGGVPIWETAPGFNKVGETTIVNPTRSDSILYSTGSGDENTNHAWLEPGLEGQYLTIDAVGNLNWHDLPVTQDNDHLIPATPAAGYLLYSTAAGDPHTAASGGDGASQWLAPGGPGQMLTMNATSTGFTWANTPLDTDHRIPDSPGATYILTGIGTGDPHTVASGGGGQSQWLAPGAAGQVLGINPTGTGFQWVDQITPDVPYDLPDAATANQLFISNAAGDPSGSGSWLARPTTDQYLTTDVTGTIVWAAKPVNTDHLIPDATLGSILVGVGNGDPHTVASGGAGQSQWLAPGQPGQILTIGPTGTPVWDECCYDLPDATGARQLFVSNGAGDPSTVGQWLTTPTGNQYLTTDPTGNLLWQAIPAIPVDTNSLIPNSPGAAYVLTSTGPGDVHTAASGGGGQSQWLAPGAPGSALTINPAGNGFTWATLPAQYDLPDSPGPGAIAYFNNAGDPSGTQVYLPAGTAGQILSMNGAANAPAWIDPVVNSDHVIPDTTIGALLVGIDNGDPHTTVSGGAGASQWLQPGQPGQILTVGPAGTPIWNDCCYDLPDSSGVNQIFVSTGAGDPSTSARWLAAPGPNQYLTTDGVNNFVWQPIPAVGTDTNFQIPVTPGTAHILTSTGVGDPHTAASGGGGQSQWLAPGVAGQILAINPTATGFQWIDQVTPDVPYDLPDATTDNQLFISNAPGDPSGTGTWLAKPATDQYLTTDGAGNVLWIPKPLGTDHLIPDAPGDAYLLTSTGVGDPHTTASGGGGQSEWLQPGDPGEVLTINAAGDGFVWNPVPTQYDLPDSPAIGAIAYFTGVGDPQTTQAYLLPGNPGQLLSMNGAGNGPEWIDPVVDTNSMIPDTIVGSVLIGIGNGDPHTAVSGGDGNSQWLAPGLPGQTLTVGPAGTPVWDDCCYDLPDATAGRQIFVSNGAGDPSAVGTWIAAPGPDQYLTTDAGVNFVWLDKVENTDHLIPQAPGLAYLLISNGTGDPHTLASGGGGNSEWKAPGNPGEVLTTDATTNNLIWTPLPENTDHQIPPTTVGSLLVGTAAGDPHTAASGGDGASQWLAPGQAGQILTVGPAGTPIWNDCCYDLPDAASNNQLFYSNGAGDPSNVGTWLNAPGPDQYLTTDQLGNLSWQTIPAVSTDTNYQIPVTPGIGSILTSTGIGDPHTVASGGGGNSQWLAPGQPDQILTMGPAGSPLWRDCCYDLPDSTAVGQIAVFSGAGDPSATQTYLNPGTNGQILTVVNGRPQWQDCCYDLADATTNNQLFYSSGAGDPSGIGQWLAAPGPEQYLTTNAAGNLVWQAIPAVGANTNSLIPSAVVGGLLTGTANADPHTVASGGGGASQWLAPGQPGQILTVSPGGVPFWDDCCYDLPDATTAGQLAVFSGAGDPSTTQTYLNPGNDGQILTVVNGQPQWQDCCYDLPDATANNQLFYANGAGDPSGTGTWLTAPRPDQYLTTNAAGNLVWAAIPAATVDTNSLIPDATLGAILTGTGDGDPHTAASGGDGNSAWLAPGQPGQILTVSPAGVPFWDDCCYDLPDSTATGQLAVFNGAGDPSTTQTYLNPGNNGQILTIVNGQPRWQDCCYDLPDATTNNQLFYANGAGDPSGTGTWLVAPGPDQYLTTNAAGNLVWQAIPAVVGDTNSLIPDATLGAILTGTGAGDPHTTASGGDGNSSWLAPGQPGQILTVSPGGVPFWDDCCYDLPDATAANQLFVANGAGDPSSIGTWLAAPGPDQHLTTDALGNLVWAAKPNDTDHLIPDATLGAILTGTGVGDPHTAASGGGGNSSWLAPGQPGQILTVSPGGVPFWDDCCYDLPDSTATGQLAVFSGAGDPSTTQTYLNPGNNGQILTIVNGQPQWQDCCYDLPDATANNQLFYANGAGDPSGTGTWLAAPGPDQYLTTNAAGNLVWAAIPAVNTDHLIPDSPGAVRILTSTGAGDPHTVASGGSGFSEWLAPGAARQVLAINPTGTGFQWIDQVTPTVPYDLPDSVTDNQLFISNAAGDPSGTGTWLPKPTTDQYLTTDAAGNVVWAPKPVESDHLIPDTTNGSLLIGIGTGDPHTAASGGGGNSQWLTPGQPGQTLTISPAGVPFWDDCCYDLPDSTATGQLAVFNGAGDPSTTQTYLNPGNNGQILTIVNGQPQWQDCCYDLPDATANNQLFYANGAGDPSGTGTWLAAPGPDQYLTTNAAGNLVWQAIPTVVGDTNSLIPDATVGSILTGTGAGDPHTTASGGDGNSAWLAPGQPGQILTVSPGGVPFWDDCCYDLPDSTAANQIFIANGAGDPSTTGTWMAAPGPDQYLTTNAVGNFVWLAKPVDNDHLIPDSPGVAYLLTSVGLGDPHTVASGGGGNSDWLPPGNAGEHLAVNQAGTGLEWVVPADPYDLPDSTAAGQIAIFNGAGDPSTTQTYLNPGNDGQILTIVNGQPVWEDCCYDLPNSTATGQLAVFNGVGDPSTTQTYLDPGTIGQILTINAAGQPEWTDAPAATVDTNSLIPDAITGAILTGTANADPHTAASGGAGGSQWLAPGTNGQILTIVNGTPQWQDCCYDLPDATAANQLFYANGAGDPSGTGTWLAAPGPDQYLTTNAAGNLVWAAIPAGVTDTDSHIPDSPGVGYVLTSTAAGDPHATATSTGGTPGNASAWLAPGTAGQVLTVGPAGTPIWSDCCYDLPDATANQQIAVFSGAGDPSTTQTYLNVGTVGQTLTVVDVGGIPTVQWADLPAGAVDTDSQLPDAPGVGAVLIGIGAGDPHIAGGISNGGGQSDWLPVGTDGQILTVQPDGTIAWDDCCYSIPDSTQAEQLFISTGVGDPGEGQASPGVWLDPGTANQVLTVVDDGAGNLTLEWADLPAGTVDTDSHIPDVPNTANGGVGFILTSQAAGDPHATATSTGGAPGDASVWLAPGANGQILTSVDDGAGNISLQWQDCCYDLPDSTAANQLAVFNGAGDPSATQTYLDPGTTGQVLQIDAGGNLVWATLPAGTTDTDSQLPDAPGVGSILIGVGVGDPHIAGGISNGGGQSDWLPVGTDGQILTVQPDGTIAWDDCCYNLPDSTAANQIAVFNGAGDPSATQTYLDPGTTGQVLQIDAGGNLVWATLPAGTTDTDSQLPDAPGVGSILIGVGAGDPHIAGGISNGGGQSDWLPVGTDGQILTVQADGTIAWDDCCYDLADSTATNQLFVSTGASDPSVGSASPAVWLAGPTAAGQVLTYADDGGGNLTLQWVAPTTGGTDNDSRISNTTVIGEILVSSATPGDPHDSGTSINGAPGDGSEWLAPGTEFQLLTMTDTGGGTLQPQWQDLCTAFLELIKPDVEANACIKKSNVADVLDPTEPTGVLGYALDPFTGADRVPYWFQFQIYQPGLAIGRFNSIPDDPAPDGRVTVALTAGTRHQVGNLTVLDNRPIGSSIAMGTDGIITVSRDGYYTFTMGSTINARLRNLVPGGIWSATISIVIRDAGGANVKEVRGNQYSFAGDQMGYNTTGVDFSVNAQLTTYLNAGQSVFARVHWFNGTAMGGETIDLTFNQSPQLETYAVEIPFAIPFITQFP